MVTAPKLEASIHQHPEVEQEPLTPMQETTTRDKNQSQENRSQEIAPVINTDIEQTLRVTTTTTPKMKSSMDARAEQSTTSPSSYPATESLKSLLNLIPEQHQQPMIKALVNQALDEYSIPEVQEAIVYASANVKGGAMQNKAYLDKTLQNQ